MKNTEMWSPADISHFSRNPLKNLDLSIPLYLIADLNLEFVSLQFDTPSRRSYTW